MMHYEELHFDKINDALLTLNDAVNLIAPKRKSISINDKINKYVKVEDATQFTASQQSQPWSYSDFLERTRTFSKTANWFAKPECISPLQCARYGWKNAGLNTLKCSVCDEQLRHSSDDSDGAILSEALVKGHSPTCSWSGFSSPESFLYFPDSADEQLVREFVTRFIHICSVLDSLISQLTEKDTQYNGTTPTVIGLSNTNASSGHYLPELVIGGQGLDARVLSLLGLCTPEQSETEAVRFDRSITLLLLPAGSSAAATPYFSSLRPHNASESINQRLLSLVQNRYSSNQYNSSVTNAPLQQLIITVKDMLSDAVKHDQTGVQIAESLLRVAMTLALFGWDLVSSAAPAAQVYPEVGESEARSLLDCRDNSRSILQCNLCGRSIDLTMFCRNLPEETACVSSSKSTSTGTPWSSPSRMSGDRILDPAAQHRSYCPWVADNKTSDGKSCGWRVMCDEFLQTAESTSVGAISCKIAEIETSEKIISVTKRGRFSLEPDDAYRRVKAILDGAVL